jgi:sugar/nucleoside kinase (ribokinase family)
MAHKIYIYGMTLWSTIHRLKSGYPAAGTYGEIEETCSVPGGEAANAALLLDHWGCQVVLDGCHLGEATAQPLRAFFEKTGVDLSLLPTEPGFPGWRDLVLTDPEDRTVFGWFGQYFEASTPHWTDPDRAQVAQADYVLLDPFFPGVSVRLARDCNEAATPYATIDVPVESPMVRQADLLILSREYLEREFPGKAMDAIQADYASACSGLLVITRGETPVLFHDSGSGTWHSRPVVPIQAVDTLAAGDAYRAGLAFARLEGYEPSIAVELANSTSALTCLRYPSIHPIPDWDEVLELHKETYGG